MAREEGRRDTLWPDPLHGPWLVEVFFWLIDGRVECIKFTVSPAPGEPNRPVTNSVLRAVAPVIGELRERHKVGLRKLARIGTTPQLRKRAAAELQRFDAPKNGRGGRPPLYGPSHFVEVAEIYGNGGNRPTGAVAEHFNVSSSAAAKWVAKARLLKLLPPASNGRGGGFPLPEDET